MALCNRELHARNDDDDTDIQASITSIMSSTVSTISSTSSSATELTKLKSLRLHASAVKYV